MTSRRVRAVTVLLAALLVVGCSTGGADSGGAEATPGPATRQAPAMPPTLEELPEGPASSLPWYGRGRLHLGDTALRMPRVELRHANGTTIAGRNRVGGSEWFLVEADGDRARLWPLVRSAEPLHVSLSADGSTVVWRETLGADLRRVTAYDVASRRRLGSIRVPVETVCCDGGGDVYVTSILTDGRVVWHTADRRPAVVWRPGERTTVPLRGNRNTLTIGGWPGGVMWQGRSPDPFASIGVYATVGRNGAVRRQGRVPTDQLGGWSPDGTVYVYPGQEDGSSTHKSPMPALWAQDIETGERRRLGLTLDGFVGLAAWESPTDVLVTVEIEDPQGQTWARKALVRCDVTDLACERVADFPARPVGLPVW